jgi:hypothetical protein
VDQGLLVAKDLTRLDEESLMNIFPSAGALVIKAMAKMKLKTLRVWTINQSNLIKDPDENIEILYFMEDICDKQQRKLALMDKSTKDGSQSKMAAGVTPGTFNGKGAAWPSSKRKFLAYLGQHRSRLGIPLIYVVRDDNDRQDDPSVLQDEIWSAPLSGPFFDQDNYTVYQILCQWMADRLAVSHVDMFKDTCDGRSAWQRLTESFEGDDTKQTAIAEAQNSLKVAKYTGDKDNFKFDDYCTKIETVHNELARLKVIAGNQISSGN